jgi:hypothetical protein
MAAPPRDVAERLSQRIEAFTRKTGRALAPPK